MTRDEVLAEIEKAKRENATELDLSFKELTELPPEIAQLTALTSLFLTNNQLQSLPPEIAQLTALTELYLHNNQLQSLPPEIAQLSALTGLFLSKNQLQSLPPEIGQLSALTRLYLDHNQLQSLPPEIGKLTALTRLDLANNQLQSLPPEIAQLTALTWLNLSDNQLQSLHPEIGQLTALTILGLFDNQLQSLPPEIAQLTALTSLSLSNNQLQSLPSEIGQLTALTMLDLANNQLQLLPEIKQLKNLIVLDLRNNPCFANAPTHLTMQGQGVYVPTHAPQLPDELLQKESWFIYSYLNDTLNQENRPLNEAKLILVGEGAVGKTSLVKRLINNDFDEQEIKTEGINRNLWRLPLGDIDIGIFDEEKAKEIVRVNVWDFGGQEIMHATHQFFLTKRSVYILVLDARRGEQESRLEYWLKLVHSFGSDSPIIIAINKSDEHSLDLNQPFLKVKYPSIQAFCTISCKTGNGIAELKKYITSQIANLKDVKTPLPQTWFELKGALETLSDNYINYARYEQLCEQYQITESDSQKTLLSLLHDLGIVLNFQDDDRFDHLKETNVLNPAWVTDGVYKIINNNALFQTQGKLKLADLGEILDKQDYPTKKEHQFILDMMQKFELCFPFDDEKHCYLIPELLQKSEPDLNWNSENSLAFQYHYDVLPHSVISRFIVRMNQYISKQTYWRTGVVLTYQQDSNKALIKADIEDKKIYISLNGNSTTRREFLAIIRRDFEHIHSTIKGLKVENKLVYKNVPLDYERFLMLEKKGIKEDLIESLDEMVNVKTLLSGIEIMKIENQTINSGNQQFTDKIVNQNRNINARNYIEGNVSDGNIAGRDIHIIHNHSLTDNAPKVESKTINAPKVESKTINAPKVESKTILVAAASPNNEARLRLDIEVRDIEEGLKLSKHRDDFVLQKIWATRVRDLRRAMQEHNPAIVHFCGHGLEQGILLEDNQGKAQLVSQEALAGFFELFDTVECVILNACFSEMQAEAITEHISYVIGMSDAIGDQAAIEFAVAFYDSLAAGQGYEKAYKIARNAIAMEGIAGELIPKLFKKNQ